MIIFGGAAIVIFNLSVFSSGAVRGRQAEKQKHSGGVGWQDRDWSVKKDGTSEAGVGQSSVLLPINDRNASKSASTGPYLQPVHHRNKVEPAAHNRALIQN